MNSFHYHHRDELRLLSTDPDKLRDMMYMMVSNLGQHHTYLPFFPGLRYRWMTQLYWRLRKTPVHSRLFALSEWMERRFPADLDKPSLFNEVEDLAERTADALCEERPLPTARTVVIFITALIWVEIKRGWELHRGR